MGGWDYYCFVCATSLQVPYEFIDGEDDEDDDSGEDCQSSNKQSPAVLFPKEMIAGRLQWLSKWRTIGQNRNATGLTQCYLSGPAEHDMDGTARIQRGDHPNTQSLPDDCVECYRNEDGENGDLPVHDRCFALLCRVFAMAQRTNYHWTPEQSSTSLPFDLDALFVCLASVREEYLAYLRLDHTFEPDQYAWGDWDRVYDFFDPFECPKMHPYAATTDETNPATTETGSQHDTRRSFDSLPQELLDHLLDMLPQNDLISLIKASNTVRRATRTNKFWKRRLEIDAPWLWEADQEARTTNWQDIYRAVMMQVHKPFQIAAAGIHVSGLANRKRIWRVCQQILDMYLMAYPPRASRKPISVFEEGVVCRYLPKVAHQKKTQFQSDTAFFFTTHTDIRSPKHLKLSWSENGALCGLSLITNNGEATFGACSHDTESRLEIQQDDWIEKMVLNISIIESWTTRTNYGETHHRRLAVTGIAIWQLSGGLSILGKNDGFKRLLEPLPGHGIVGFKTHSAEGRITHLGLLEHLGGLTKLRAANDPKRLDLLWDDRLPPADLRFKPYASGYWTAQTNWDLAPMQTLIFGSTDREQSTMVGVAVSSSFDCFHIYRSDGSCERIGQSRGQMKVFQVDGPGGERIVGYQVTIGPLPVGLTLVTSFGRQVVFGRRRDNATQMHTSEPGFGVAGIYCSFDYRSIPEAMMSSLGLIQSPHIDRPAMDEHRMTDENGLFWETKPPPTSWLAVGPMYGAEDQGEVAVCIDFSRPVSRIDGLFPAPEWLDVIEIGGFNISYGDDNTQESMSHLGFLPQQWPPSVNATPEDLRKMQRHPGMSMFVTRDKDTGKAHVLTDEDALTQPKTWDLGTHGEKIVAVTVWAGAFLDGLQFHSESGTDSPRWGKCGGIPSGTIRTGGEDSVVGLKIILGSRRLGHQAATLSPQAVQAMCNAPR